MTASNLKSTDGPLLSVTPNVVALPPGEGAVLQSVYESETRHMRRMRTGGTDAIWYDWVPHLSLSVSAREAARLGDLSGFRAEPVAIRGTGGTAVPQGPGTINISVLSHHPTHPGIHETYAALCGALIEGFAAMGLETAVGAKPGSFCDGEYNLLLGGKKLVGTAQRWAMGTDGSAICLHHCVILTGDPDTLCARAEALYEYAEQPVRYDRDAHADVRLDRAALRAAMAAPLDAYLRRAEEDRI